MLPSASALQLVLDPPVVWAYSDAKATWREQSQRWDSITLLYAGKRKTWSWCQGNQSWMITVGEPGDYAIQYRRNAGYVSDGDLYQSLPVPVKSPVTQLSAPGQVKAGDQLTVSWTLAALVGVGYAVHLQVDDDGSPVTLQSQQMLAHTNTHTLTGQADFVAPRMAGAFTLCVRGSSCSESVLMTKTFHVSVDPAMRDHTFVQAVIPDGAKRALVSAPGAVIEVEWSFPQFLAGDMLCLFEGRCPGRVIVNPKLTMTLNHREGRTSFRAPSQPLDYCVCLCASYRSGKVVLPVSYCHLFVSEMADRAPGVATSVAWAAPKPAASSPLDDETSFSKPQCIICMSADVNCMVEPCGHAQFCKTCLERSFSRAKKCPVCRADVSRHQEIYLP